MKTISNEEYAIEVAENISPYDIGGDNAAHYAAKDAALDALEWKDEQILLDDDDKLATEVKVDGVTITPPQGYLIGKVTHIKDSLIVELKKKK